MKQWEYKIEEIPDVWDSEDLLNQLGSQGWELVGIYRDDTGDDAYVYAVFKRPA